MDGFGGYVARAEKCRGVAVADGEYNMFLAVSRTVLRNKPSFRAIHVNALNVCSDAGKDEMWPLQQELVYKRTFQFAVLALLSMIAASFAQTLG